MIEELAASGLVGRALRERAMALLSQKVGYDWCGVYRLDGDVLELDAFVGEPTDHTLIPVGVGVCGTAVAENRNVVVEDVRALDNYLSCSAHTRSEIVVLIRQRGRVLGQLDIDGNRVGAFGVADEAMLEELAAVLASRWEESEPTNGRRPVVE